MMDDHKIERKEELRDLGLLVDHRMTLIAHMEQTTTKARQSMGYIKWISKGQFGTRALKVLYTSYVRSKLEFASVLWDPHAEVYRNDIESIQKQFVMYALGDTNRIPPYRLTPYEERCGKLGLEKLETRRNVMNCMLAFDLFNGIISDKNIDKRLIKLMTKYNLRDNRLLLETLYLSDYSYNQPIAKVIRNVNEFSDLMMLSRTRFKNEIKGKLGEKRDDI